VKDASARDDFAAAARKQANANKILRALMKRADDIDPFHSIDDISIIQRDARKDYYFDCRLFSMRADARKRASAKACACASAGVNARACAIIRYFVL